MNADTAEAAVNNVAAPPDAFHFGQNWRRYVSRHLDAERERIAQESLRELIGDLSEQTFLDIGCGSGLFSLCAHRAGASRVVSIDVDDQAVATTRYLRSLAGSPANWEVLHRSILDPDIGNQVEPADVVYSWGVLHHTGDMYAAIRNATALVKPGGRLAIAIYNHVTEGWLNSERWWRIKRAYNHAARPGQIAMELAYAVYWFLAHLAGGENPLRVARDYRGSRGMALWTDLVDWLGGYPYEFASTQEMLDFCQQTCGLRCIALKPCGGTGNNEFLFELPLRAQ